MLTKLFNSLIVLMTISTATGVLVHDAKIDKMASAIMTPPAVSEGNVKTINFATDFHTHTERHSLGHAIRDLRTPSPSMQPNARHDKKHLMQKFASRGHHAFDNYNLPLV